MLPLEMLVEVIDFYLLISRTWACPVERQTSLFHLIRARFLRDNRIHHRELERSACHDDDILLYADHICRHADAMIQIRPECIKQICYNLFICFRCIHRFLCQEQRLREQGTIISSSYIREQIEQGAVDVVREYMGRPYSISGIVQYGKQLGATIGFPTANLIPTEEKLLVPNGVYETRVTVNNQHYRGVTNVGDNPTVDADHKIKVETNILDFNENLYGTCLKIEFLRQIRKEIKFDSIEALKNQIKSDILEVAHQ